MTLNGMWIFRFLKWFCPDHLFEEIEGDLIQKFNRDIKKFGNAKANRRLIWNTIRFCRPGIILRNRFSFELNHLYMFKSYLTILFRHTLKRKFYSSINVLCLTVGITFALLIGLFIHSELQVNQDLKDVDRLYLMESRDKPDVSLFPFSPGILPKQMLDQYPGKVEGYYSFLDRNITISKGDKHFRLQSMIGDSSFLEFFGFPLLHGDRESALKQPNSIVITQRVALKFFNKTDVVGETLTLATEQKGLQEYTITAVMTDPSDKNSITDFMNMDAQVFLSLANAYDFFPQFQRDSWQEIITYIKLTSPEVASDVQEQLNAMLKDGPGQLAATREIVISPIHDYYRTTNQGAVQKLIVTLVVIVIFILLLAVSNFINISIASSFSRFKEVGVRKVIGGLQRQVVTQFLLESVVLSVFSGSLAVIGYELLHDYFGVMLASTLPSVFQFDKTLWLAITGGVLGIGFLAGIYPAVFQSLARPIDSLKGKMRSVKGTIQFSRSLITIQFFITLLIFISAVVLSRQTSYFLEKDLGYDKSHVLTVTSVPRLWNEAGFAKMESAKKEFMRSAAVESVSLSWGSPGRNFSPGGGKVYKSGTPAEEGINFVITCADEEFQPVFGLKLKEGNFFGDSGTRVANAVVINEAAKKVLDIKLGDQLKANGYGDTIFTVKGIVHDFHFTSLHQRVDPMMLIHTNDFQAYRYFSFRLKPANLAESVREVETRWKNVFPDDPFDFHFADQSLEILYTTELQMKKAAMVATALMLIIVFTGVLGLVSLSVSKRSKEIGIRKVLGASLSNILLLVSKEYFRLIAAAFVVTVPLAYFFAMKWLQGFEYHIDLTWWMFVLPMTCLLFVIIVIVCAQTLKSALSNPVNSLKYE
ncbi:MAG TPA: ABC transporter permease [Ohtaekwangia sp.]